MFKSLLPKEEKYFENFKEMISNLQQMAKITYDFFSAEKIDTEIFLKLKPIEKKLDDLSNKVTNRLNKIFITPIDREDIYSLTKKLDSIADILLGAAVRVDTYNVTEKIKYADKLAAIVLQQIDELEKVIQILNDKSGNLDKCKAVRVLESEADNIFRTAIKELFTTEKDPLTIIKKKEILEMLERATDKCQSTANVIISIFIKNS